MKCFVIFASILVLAAAADNDVSATSNIASTSTFESTQQLDGAASSFDPLLNKRQEKRYVPYTGIGGYGGYAGYGGAIDSTLGYQSGYYNPYNNRALASLGVYNGYNSPYTSYGSNYNLGPYYNSRVAGYPFYRPGYGHNSYPSSYYSSYANSIVGGGLGGLGPAGIVPPVTLGGGALGTGYQYGPGISSTIY